MDEGAARVPICTVPHSLTISRSILANFAVLRRGAMLAKTSAKLLLVTFMIERVKECLTASVAATGRESNRSIDRQWMGALSGRREKGGRVGDVVCSIPLDGRWEALLIQDLRRYVQVSDPCGCSY